jgi:hypothetical protein
MLQPYNALSEQHMTKAEYRESLIFVLVFVGELIDQDNIFIMTELTIFDRFLQFYFLQSN